MSMFSMVSSVSEILSTLSYFLLVILTSVTLGLFPRFSISRVSILCDFFIVSISIFKSWTVLFNSFTCLIVFSCISLRDFCVSSLWASTCLPVFCIFLRELLMFSFKVLHHLHKMGFLGQNLAFLVF